MFDTLLKPYYTIVGIKSIILYSVMCSVHFFYGLTCLYLTWFRHITQQEKSSITTIIIVAITTKSLQEGVTATTKKLVQAIVINSKAIGLHSKKISMQ